MFILQKPVARCFATLSVWCLGWTGAAAAEQARAESFWSFAPLAAPEVPEVVDGSWPRTAIDRFILARLEAEGIGPAFDADPAKLIRQLSFDLIGLPPSREEVDAFNADPSEARYHRAVDRLLSSPHFGERWGRHWLDVARYAEATWRGVWMTNAWRYRDYVVDAFNRPIAGLLQDLKQRGLLADTLVWWGGEFGRNPFAQGKDGRDHNPNGFTMWLAGGGVKGGYSHGHTDEFGHYAVSGKTHMHDLHATILYLLGLDHERLTFPYSGRDFRLTDVHGEVVRDVIA